MESIGWISSIFARDRMDEWGFFLNGLNISLNVLILDGYRLCELQKLNLWNTQGKIVLSSAFPLLYSQDKITFRR